MWIAALAIVATAGPIAIGFLASRGEESSAVSHGTAPRAAGRALKGSGGITYSVAVTPPLKAGAVGWCLSLIEHYPPADGGGGGGAGCGGTRLGAPFVASQIGGFGTQSESFVDYVYVTTAQVAAVRVSPTLTLRTRDDPRLPAGDRIAIGVVRADNAVTQAPVALTSAGESIAAHPLRTVPSEPAVFWAHTAAPPAACELEIRDMPAATPTFGDVAPRVRAFPQLAAGTLLSCASMSFTIHRETVNAAILLDARHPGIAPGPLPGTTGVAHQSETVNEPARSTAIDLALTARRVGNAWLLIEANGSLASRLRILDHLAICVRTSGAPCPRP